MNIVLKFPLKATSLVIAVSANSAELVRDGIAGSERSRRLEFSCSILEYFSFKSIGGRVKC